MSLHFCMTNPCPVCSPTFNGSSAPWSQPFTKMQTISTTICGELPAEREFYTWREAILQAADVANLFTTASKPRVHWRADRWLLTYTYRPTLMNGAAA